MGGEGDEGRERERERERLGGRGTEMEGGGVICTKNSDYTNVKGGKGVNVLGHFTEYLCMVSSQGGGERRWMFHLMLIVQNHIQTVIYCHMMNS